MSAPDYWKTLKGLLTRIADIAHNFTWQTLNATLKEAVIIVDTTAPEMERHKLVWKTMGDNIVCLICEDNEGPYDTDDPLLPALPAHVNCRCWWETEAST